MQSSTSDNSGFNKLKTILFHAISCNRTTLFGCIIVWVFLQHQQITDGFTDTLLATLCILPFFMGDAVSSYVLGRINLEIKNDWDDIKIAYPVKQRISKLFPIYRGIAIASSYILALCAILLMSRSSLLTSEIKYTALGIFIVNTIICLHTMITGMLPDTPEIAKKMLYIRVGIIVIVSAILSYTALSTTVVTRSTVLFGGIIYFALCGMMNPLPSKGSLLASVLREAAQKQTEILQQAKQQQSMSDDQILEYNKKPEDIEDAVIVPDNQQNHAEIVSQQNSRQEESNG